MRTASEVARADAVRAFITGLRLDPACLKPWHRYLDQLESKGHLPRRQFFRYALWVCAREEEEARMRAQNYDFYREPFEGLHRYLRTTQFLSEFGRARRSWVHVDNLISKRTRRRMRKRVFHKGRTVWADTRMALQYGPAHSSRGWRHVLDKGQTIRDYVVQLIADWKDGFCGGPPIRKLPDRKDGRHVRWQREVWASSDYGLRDILRRERMHRHG